MERSFVVVVLEKIRFLPVGNNSLDTSPNLRLGEAGPIEELTKFENLFWGIVICPWHDAEHFKQGPDSF